MDLLGRRRFLAGSTSLGMLGPSIPMGGVSAAAAAGSFRLFDSTRFVGKPDDLAACGLEPIRIVYAFEFWPGRESWDQPDLGYVEDTLVPELAAAGHDRLVLDIEHWEVEEIGKLVAVVDLMRRLMPGVRMGYYSLVPVKEYRAFQPGRERRLAGYADANRRWARLADAVDDLYPSFYTFYPDPDGWERMADGTIAAAREIGKPTYPFLWPQYHETSRKGALDLIDGPFWLRQLDKVRDAGCAGAVIWGTLAPERRTAEGRTARLAWDPAAPWWLQTRAFAEQTGLAQGSCR